MGNPNRLMEASMALLQGAPEGQLKIVVLNKGLFYLDLFALRDFGRTITEQPYVALPAGPVVDSYQIKLVGALERAGLAEQLQIGRSRPLRVRRQISTFDHLSDTELLLAKELAKVFSPLTSTLISDVSHRNPGWILARKKSVEGRPAVQINMNIAMQQIAWLPEDEDDEWMASAPDERIAHELERAKDAVLPWE